VNGPNHEMRRRYARGSAPKEFWETISHLSWGAQRDKDTTIPILIHADGAQIFRDTEYYVWSFSSASILSTHLDVVDAKFQVCKVQVLQMKDLALAANRQKWTRCRCQVSGPLRVCHDSVSSKLPPHRAIGDCRPETHR
jgi:hypothetical protein